MDCRLSYIPEHLHSKGKSKTPFFNVGEKLYYRSKPENLSRPYDNISLYNISHNRNFNNELLYPKDNVFFNIDIDDEREIYENLKIVILEIKDLQNHQTYYKEIVSKIDESLKAEIILKHYPLPCMYPHSIFEISVNNIIIDPKNYEKNLGKKNKLFSDLRSEIRQELTLIIQNGIIDSSLETEYIDKP